MKYAAIATASLIALGACNANQSTTPQTILAGALQAGQLFCQFGPLIVAAGDIKVTNAQAEQVRTACAVVEVLGQPRPVQTPVPVAAPANAVVVVGSVPASVVAAVNASRR